MIKKIKELLHKLYELNVTPNEIAYGFAVSAFLGVLGLVRFWQLAFVQFFG
ncbi:MAG: hypothetical protein M0Q46_05660 [Endomicrobiales bacterium]|nr:hypothetical protein [Endomicrobiales bacterium]